jgi:hypothetical protein
VLFVGEASDPSTTNVQDYSYSGLGLAVFTNNAGDSFPVIQ